MASIARRLRGVEDAVREHIELLNRVGEDTRSGYRYRARDHINPHLGALPVKALTWHQVTLWIRDLQNKGLSNKSIANIHGLLSAAMNTAVRLGYRPDNPCAAVRLPRSQQAGDDMVVLEPEDLDLILDNLLEHYRPFIITLVGTTRLGNSRASTAQATPTAPTPTTPKATARPRPPPPQSMSTTTTLRTNSLTSNAVGRRD